jgi:hypothetical protein
MSELGRGRSRVHALSRMPRPDHGSQGTVSPSLGLLLMGRQMPLASL